MGFFLLVTISLGRIAQLVLMMVEPLLLLDQPEVARCWHKSRRLRAGATASGATKIKK